MSCKILQTCPLKVKNSRKQWGHIVADENIILLFANNIFHTSVNKWHNLSCSIIDELYSFTYNFFANHSDNNILQFGWSRRFAIQFVANFSLYLISNRLILK